VAIECGSPAALEAAALLLAQALKGSLPAAVEGPAAAEGGDLAEASVAPLVVSRRATCLPCQQLDMCACLPACFSPYLPPSHLVRSLTAADAPRSLDHALPSYVQVANIDAPPAASAALCRYLCYPRLALKCAALREALAFMGHCGPEGSEVRGRCQV
jgi:hypothetical protein